MCSRVKHLVLSVCIIHVYNVCVCACVCVRACVRMCVYVCVCVCMCVMCLHGQEVTASNVINTHGHIRILAAISTKWAES